MFGESPYDRRDWTMGLAGFIAGLHSLRILAERGIASGEDILLSLEGVRTVLANLPEGSVDPAMMNKLYGLLTSLEETASANDGGRNNG